MNTVGPVFFCGFFKNIISPLFRLHQGRTLQIPGKDSLAVAFLCSSGSGGSQSMYSGDPFNSHTPMPDFLRHLNTMQPFRRSQFNFGNLHRRHPCRGFHVSFTVGADVLIWLRQVSPRLLFFLLVWIEPPLGASAFHCRVNR